MDGDAARLMDIADEQGGEDAAAPPALPCPECGGNDLVMNGICIRHGPIDPTAVGASGEDGASTAQNPTALGTAAPPADELAEFHKFCAEHCSSGAENAAWYKTIWHHAWTAALAAPTGRDE